MIEAFAPYVISAMWCVVCGVVFQPLSKWYVSSLISVGRFRFPWKTLASSSLWLLFSVTIVLPIFCGVVYGTRYRTELCELPIFIWFLCCYVVSLVPVQKSITSELPRLRAAGFFLDW
jgi:hypothetical protein